MHGAHWRKLGLNSTCLLFSLCLQTLGNKLAAQTTQPRSQQESKPHAPSRPGIWAPSSSHTWLHIHDLSSVIDDAEGHETMKGWSELFNGSNNTGNRIQSFWHEVSDFIERKGFSPKLFNTLFARDVRLSMFRSEGKPDFLMFLDVTGIEEELTAACNNNLRHATTKQKKDIWILQNPLSGPSRLYLNLNESTFVVAGSPEALEQGLTLMADEGASLAFEPSFTKLFARETGAKPSSDDWLQIFMRPGASLSSLLPDKGKAGMRSPFIDLLLNIPALVYRSSFGNGAFKDDVRIMVGEKDRYPFNFTDEGGLSAAMPRLVPLANPDFLLSRISIVELFRFLSRLHRGRDGFEFLAELNGILARSQTRQTTEDLGTMLGRDFVVIKPGKDNPSWGIIVSVADSFALTSLLEQVATKQKKAPTENKTLHIEQRYKLSFAEHSFYLAVTSDRLFISDDEPGLQTYLSFYQSGRENIAIKKRLNKEGVITWLLGKTDLSDWLVATGVISASDRDDRASIFSPIAISSSADENIVHFKVAAGSGLVPYLSLPLPHVMDRLIEGLATWHETVARESAELIRKAEIEFVQTAAARPGGEGVATAGSLDVLLDKALLPSEMHMQRLGNGIAEWQGYRYRVLLPKGDHGQKNGFAVLAWPSRPGRTGSKAVLVLPNGTIYEMTELGGMDPERGPQIEEVFTELAFESALAPAWRPSDPRVTQALLSAREQPEPSGQPDANMGLKQVVGLVDNAAQRKDGSTLVTYLQHPNEDIQARAAYYLGNIKYRASVPALAGLMKRSKNPKVRRNVAKALMALRDSRATASLMENLSDEDAWVRLFAATGLIKTDAPGALEALLALVDNYTENSVGDRTQALLAIHDLGRKDCLKLLVGTSKGSDEFQDALVLCFQDLSPLHDPQRELNLLASALDNPNPRLRLYAIQRLGALGRVDAIPILEARHGKELPALKAQIDESLAALQPSIDFNVAIEKIKERTSKAYDKFMALNDTKKYAIGAGTALLVFLGLVLLIRRRRRRRAYASSDVSGLIAPSHDSAAGFHQEAVEVSMQEDEDEDFAGVVEEDSYSSYN